MNDPAAFGLQDAYAAAQALCLAAARLVGVSLFLPALDHRYLGRIGSHAVCIALSLPQAALLWEPLRMHMAGPWSAVLFGLKEVLVGGALGAALALPFWAVSSALTLVDNQRGANAAQVANPSLAADASILGELAERACIATLVQSGRFVLLFDLVADSYQAWPILHAWPGVDASTFDAAVAAFERFLADALSYGAPALLLLLLIELGLACIGAVVEGVQVYLLSPPLKSLVAPLLIALYLGVVLSGAGDGLARALRAPAPLAAILGH